jgi:hypothetical protein
MRMRLLALLLTLLVGSAEAATFPTAVYTSTNKAGSCTVDADCGVGSDAKCSSGVCLWKDVKTFNLAEEIEAIETGLCANFSCVLKPTDIDTSAELRGILGDETGTGLAVFGTHPTLNGPVLTTYTVAGLPAAGTSTGAVYVVRDYLTSCDSGGGGATGVDPVLCRDNGATYDRVGGGGSTGGSSGLQVCKEILSDPLADNEVLYWWPVPIRLVAAGCRCTGTCTTPATFSFETGGGTAIGLTGGGALTCATSDGTAVTYVTFDTGDLDRYLATGAALRFDTTNTPGTSDPVRVCVTFAFQ